MFKIAKMVVKTNQDIFVEQCIRNDDGVLAVSDEDQKIAWKNYHEVLLITTFAWDRNSLSSADATCGISCLIGKGMVIGSVSKINSGKAAGPSYVVAEMVKAAGEAAVDMITKLVSWIIGKGNISCRMGIYHYCKLL